jgi:hypothetical protein
MVQQLNNQRLIDTQHNEALMNRYKCSLSKCPNGIGKLGGWCVIVDDVHLKLMPAHMTTWSIAINDDLADIENAPPGLFKSLMPSKTGTINPLRVSSTPSTTATIAATTTQVTETPILPPTAVAHAPAAQYPHYPYPASLPPPPPPAYPFYSPYAMSGHYPFMPPHPHYQYSPHVPERRSQRHWERSSSIFSDVDPVEQMKDYFAWMIRRTPSQEGDLTATLKEFLKTNQSFETIKDITDTEFVHMKVENGLRNQIRGGVAKFARHYNNKR